MQVVFKSALSSGGKWTLFAYLSHQIIILITLLMTRAIVIYLLLELALLQHPVSLNKGLLEWQRKTGKRQLALMVNLFMTFFSMLLAQIASSSFTLSPPAHQPLVDHPTVVPH